MILTIFQDPVTFVFITWKITHKCTKQDTSDAGAPPEFTIRDM